MHPLSSQQLCDSFGILFPFHREGESKCLPVKQLSAASRELDCEGLEAGDALVCVRVSDLSSGKREKGNTSGETKQKEQNWLSLLFVSLVRSFLSLSISRFFP